MDPIENKLGQLKQNWLDHFGRTKGVGPSKQRRKIKIWKTIKENTRRVQFQVETVIIGLMNVVDKALLNKLTSIYSCYFQICSGLVSGPLPRNVWSTLLH
jgi:hypothetical protein